MQCKNVSPFKRKLCIGDLDKLIKIETRSIAPETDDVDYTQNFSTLVELWSSLKTVSGIEIFDGTNLEGVATHLWGVMYQDGVTSLISKGDMVLFNSKYYNILTIENLDERNEWLILKTSERGTTSNKVNWQ